MGRMDTNELLACGHPAQCLREDDEGESSCAWCEEVASLRTEIRSLTGAIHGKAVIVNDGSPTIEGDVGYLLINSGTVRIGHREYDVARLRDPIRFDTQPFAKIEVRPAE